VLYGLALATAAYFYLPETHPPSQRTRLHIVPILRSTAEVMSHAEFLRLALASGLCFVALHIYLGASPAIVLDHWHLDETQFYVLTIPIIGGFTIGAWLSGRFAGTARARWQAAAGFLVLLLTTVLMLLLQALVRSPPLYLQQLDLVVMALGLQLMYPVVTLKILDLFPQARGAAASAQSFISLILGALAMGLFAPLLVQSMLHIAWAALGVGAVAWLLWRQSITHQQRGVVLHPPG
jgi:DHA1 family bicyclomycin/chloramphenicol resistance-like MFS transporter